MWSSSHSPKLLVCSSSPSLSSSLDDSFGRFCPPPFQAEISFSCPLFNKFLISSFTHPSPGTGQQGGLQACDDRGKLRPPPHRGAPVFPALFELSPSVSHLSAFLGRLTEAVRGGGLLRSASPDNRPELPTTARPQVKHGQMLTERRGRRARCTCLQFACWNVRTLASELRIMSDGTLSVEGKEPQKLEELCNELARHNIGLAAISEHRWKGEGVYCVYQVNAEWKFIYSGLPLQAPKAQSGVGFLLVCILESCWGIL